MRALSPLRLATSSSRPRGPRALAAARVLAGALALGVGVSCAEAPTTGGVKRPYAPLDLDAAGFVLGTDGPTADTGATLGLGGGRWQGALPLGRDAVAMFTGGEGFVAWTAELDAASVLSLSVRGTSGLDTVLLVYGPADRAGRFGARPVAQDDDGAGGGDPRLTRVTAARGGTYAVVVAPYTRGDRGRFTLTATCGAGCEQAEPASATLDRARAEVGERVEVTLTNAGDADGWLDACAPFAVERWEAARGEWSEEDADVACDGEEPALRVPANGRHTEGWRPAAEGRFRVVFTVGRRCTSDEPFVSARCAELERVESEAVEVGAGDPGEPSPGPDDPPVSGDPELPRGDGECVADNDCVVTGCNDEVCGAGAVDTACGALDAYACLQHTHCGCFSGRCDWAPTFAWRTCIDNASP